MSKIAQTQEHADSTHIEGTSPSEAEVLQLETGGFFHHWPNLVYCCIVSLGGFQLGLDLAAIAGLQAMPGFLRVFGFEDPTAVLGYGIDPTVQQLISSLMSLGAVIGAVSTGPLSQLVSRKWLLLLGIVLNNLGVIFMMATTGLPLLYAGRFIVGLANGFLMVIPQLYIQECATARQRGPLVGFAMVLTGIGQLVGSIVDNYTAKLMSKNSYVIPLGLFLVIPTMLGLLLPWVPESPRWLVEHGKVDAARRSLVRLRAKKTSLAIIEGELEEMQEFLEAERLHSHRTSPLEMFHRANIRQTFLTYVLMISLAGAGSLLFQMFGTYFFAVAGQTNAFEESVGLTAAGTGGTIIALWVITKVGRRTLLLSGFFLQAVCMIIVAGVATESPMSRSAGSACVAFSIIFMFVFNLACSPLLYLVAAEIPSQRLRGYTVGTGIGLAFLFNWLCSFTAPYFINPQELNWGPKYGYIWFGSNVIIGILLGFILPETKDRTLEEIDEMFKNKVPARKFKNYVCTESAHARAVGAQHAMESKVVDVV